MNNHSPWVKKLCETLGWVKCGVNKKEQNKNWIYRHRLSGENTTRIRSTAIELLHLLKKKPWRYGKTSVSSDLGAEISSRVWITALQEDRRLLLQGVYTYTITACSCDRVMYGLHRLDTNII